MAVESPQLTRERTLCLVGNPNTGKSVIFGILTGTYVTVSNYPGTTVEILKGSATLEGARLTVIDTPGTNSLIPMSEDERVTRDILLDQPPDIVVQVGDSKNLKRVLAITLQLADMGLPMVLVLNMADEAQMRGIHIDTQALEEILGIPVVSTTAIDRTGVDDLLGAIRQPRLPQPLVTYAPSVETAIGDIADSLPTDCVSRRGLALLALCSDDTAIEWIDRNVGEDCSRKVVAVRERLDKSLKAPSAQAIMRQRLQTVNGVFQTVTHRTAGEESPLAAWVGRMAMHPIWGLPFLALTLWGMYKFVGILGAGTLVGLLENQVFGRFINPAAISLFSHVPIPFVRDLFVGEYGIITMALTYGVAIVMPVVFTFFTAFSVLEDSGYLPRLAVMVNNLFRAMGLNGKAVLPMVLGLGCDTMATLTTRVLETKRERTIVTLLLALGVPCSAQLGVIMALLQGNTRSMVIWGSVVGLVMLVVGFLAGKVMPGKGSDFIMEVPPIRLPKIGNILSKTLARTEWYIKEAVPLFILGTVVLFGMDKLHILGFLERVSSPVVTGVLGLPTSTTKVFVMGFLRRDYGGAGLMAMRGSLTADDILVALVTITLFIPCIANFLVMGRERGWKSAIGQAAFIVPLSVLVGGLVRLLLRSGLI